MRISEIERQLTHLGLTPGRVALVHSAFAGLSRQGVHAEDFAGAMLDSVGPGTIAMPTMSWRAVNPESPVFDERSTPSITGALTEVFRTRFSTHRSLHPTHSVAAAGALASRLTDAHHLDRTPCGPGSPWGRLADLDALVIMLGTGMETCTLVHHLEEKFAAATYLRDEEERYRCIDRLGQEHWVVTRRHRKLMRNFWRFEGLLREAGVVRDGDVGGVRAFAFEARDLVLIGSAYMARHPDGTLAAPGEPAKLM